MTDEELEKKAEEYTSNLLKDVNCNIGHPRSRQINSIDVEDAFKDGAKAMQKENEQLQQGLKLYKKALELFVNWADECDFGYDNLGDLYSEYKAEVESLKYQEGLIHIAVSEAKKELDK